MYLHHQDKTFTPNNAYNHHLRAIYFCHTGILRHKNINFCAKAEKFKKIQNGENLFENWNRQMNFRCMKSYFFTVKSQTTA